MKPVAASIILLMCQFVSAQAHAAGSTSWSDHALQLAVTFPGDWHAVVEHGAALKVVAADGAAEFEIFPLGASRTHTALSNVAVANLTHLHCASGLKLTTGALGKLGTGAAIARGSCTGGDLGWTVSVAAVNIGTHAVLIRGWLFHEQRHDGASLRAITASLSHEA